MTPRYLIKDFLKNMTIAILIGFLAGTVVSIFQKFIIKERKHEIEFSSQLETLDN